MLLLHGLLASLLLIVIKYVGVRAALDICLMPNIQNIIRDAAKYPPNDAKSQSQAIRTNLENTFGGTWGLIVIEEPFLLTKIANYVKYNVAPIVHDSQLAYCVLKYQRWYYAVFKTGNEPGFWKIDLNFILKLCNWLLILPAAMILLQHISVLRDIVRFILLIIFRLCQLALVSKKNAFIIVFSLSCVGNYFYLIQEKQAESQARFAKLGVPIECLPKQQSILRVFYSHFTSPFRFPQNDACLQHIKDVTIDPKWKVTLIDAVIDTASVIFLRPWVRIAEHLADAINSFYSRLPVQIAPFATIFVLMIIGIMLILCLYYMFLRSRYRVSMPFFTFEPAFNDFQRVEAPPSHHVEHVPNALPQHPLNTGQSVTIAGNPYHAAVQSQDAPVPISLTEGLLFAGQQCSTADHSDHVDDDMPVPKAVPHVRLIVGHRFKIASISSQEEKLHGVQGPITSPQEVTSQHSLNANIPSHDQLHLSHEEEHADDSQQLRRRSHGPPNRSNSPSQVASADDENLRY